MPADFKQKWSPFALVELPTSLKLRWTMSARQVKYIYENQHFDGFDRLTASRLSARQHPQTHHFAYYPAVGRRIGKLLHNRFGERLVSGAGQAGTQSASVGKKNVIKILQS